MKNLEQRIKNWLDVTERAVSDIRKHKQPYTTKIFDKTIIIFPNVFSPKYFADAEFFAKEVPKIVGNKSFLEIGVGTGVVSLFVALNGASKMAGTDINPKAIENTRKNFDKNKLEIDLYLSDVFASVPEGEKFDFIFWNHPFNLIEEELDDDLLKSVHDSNFTGLNSYFANAGKYLSSEGTLILGTGDLADQSLVLEIAEKHGWRQTDVIEGESQHKVSRAEPMGLYVRQFKLKQF